MNYCKRQEAVWEVRADLNRLFFAIIWQNNDNERNTTPSTHATWHFLHACFFFMEWPQYLKCILLTSLCTLHSHMVCRVVLSDWDWLLAHLGERFPSPSYCTCDNGSYFPTPTTL